MLVSSGAIAAGLAPLGLPSRPRDLARQQAAASVGQGLLVARYTASFARYGIRVGQVLLTSDDVSRRAHYRNAYRTLDQLLAMGALPVVNENDTVATDEIRFGDNDRLAALVAHLVRADLLVLLSDVDGLYDGDPRTPGTTPDRRGRAGPRDLGGRLHRQRGQGRASAPAAWSPRSRPPDRHRRRASRSCSPPPCTPPTRWPAAPPAPTSTAPASAPPTGCCGSRTPPPRAARCGWTPARCSAVTQRHSSLLPAGLDRGGGRLRRGRPGRPASTSPGRAVARGLVNFDARELPRLLGRSTRELAAELGPAYEREVVHRDDLVLLRPARG